MSHCAPTAELVAVQRQLGMIDRVNLFYMFVKIKHELAEQLAAG